MADRQWKITATRPVLIVSNIERSVAFYTSIGFEETFRNDVVHSVLRIGDLFVHLGTKMEYAGAGLSQALIEMENVDDYYAFCKAQNAKIDREIANRFLRTEILQSGRHRWEHHRVCGTHKRGLTKDESNRS